MAIFLMGGKNIYMYLLENLKARPGLAIGGFSKRTFKTGDFYLKDRVYSP